MAPVNRKRKTLNLYTKNKHTNKLMSFVNITVSKCYFLRELMQFKTSYI